MGTDYDSEAEMPSGDFSYPTSIMNSLASIPATYVSHHKQARFK